MFEVILGPVCLGVLAVEVIEVRQKCEESYPGMWHDAHAFQPHSASLTGVRGKTGGKGSRAGERGRYPR
jgi:hypothetical protein